MLFDDVDPVGGVIFILVALVWLVASILYGRDDPDDDKRPSLQFTDNANASTPLGTR